jgi:alpha-D-ribose 1-methylphosphonate 5-triphosphate synthase subunit PhnH
MNLCRNKYFFTTNNSPGLPGLFGFWKSFFVRAQVFGTGVDVILAGLSKLTTGALLAFKRVYNR